MEVSSEMKRFVKIAVVLAVALATFIILPYEKTVGWLRYIFYFGKGRVSQINVQSPAKNLEQAQACRDNLHRIQTAKRKAGQDRGNPVGIVTWEEVIRAMYPDRTLTPAQIAELMPHCPAGGSYSVGTLEEVPRCSLVGNNTLPEDDDHIIRD